MAARLDIRDVAERAGWTFAQAFVAVLVAAGTTNLDVSTLRAAAVAGLAAVLSFAKTIITQQVGPPAGQEPADLGDDPPLDE